ncbi:MAG TPA: heterodisulfide reductase-related iron-sulfur binding cluster [Nocardioidaceae bacterium]|nr:heterodisulfide reductase-related iron-sulfur binding cluster [Nocardioidaceae bacterium]
MAQYTGYQVMGDPDAEEEEEEPLDTKRFYDNLSECYRLQVRRDEVGWEMTSTDRPGEAQVVLNLSCGIQGTPHLMLTHVAIFKALGIDFVATAGTKFCCGRPFGMSGNPDLSNRIAKHSIGRLKTWNSTVNVQCCGSCLVQFHANSEQIREETGEAPFEVIHMTEYLLRALKEMGDAVPWVREPRAKRVLLHAEGEEVHHTKVIQRNAVIETLGMVPGMEFAGLVEEPTLGAPCGSEERPDNPGSVGHTVLSDISTREYQATQRELLDQAKAVGADAIVTHHHKCTREWSKFGSPQLPIMHYQTLVADALGIDIPDRFQELWQLDDTEQILTETRPYWESWGIDEDEARDLVPKFFVPEYEASVQRCPCELDGSGSCSVGAGKSHSAADVDALCKRLGI